MNLNYERLRVHRANKKWWEDPQGKRIERNMGEMLMLVVSEFSEALEGHRKNLMDDKLPHRRMLEVELADAFIRMLDICGGLSIALEDYEEIGGSPYPFTDNFGENLVMMVRDVSRGILTMPIYGIMSLSERMNLDLEGAYEEKMAYNATRHDHTWAGRMAEGGKAY